jgi:hypothetical protein
MTLRYIPRKLGEKSSNGKNSLSGEGAWLGSGGGAARLPGSAWLAELRSEKSAAATRAALHFTTCNIGIISITNL